VFFTIINYLRGSQHIFDASFITLTRFEVDNIFSSLFSNLSHPFSTTTTLCQPLLPKNARTNVPSRPYRKKQCLPCRKHPSQPILKHLNVQHPPYLPDGITHPASIERLIGLARDAPLDLPLGIVWRYGLQEGHGIGYSEGVEKGVERGIELGREQ
jgi:hypothetical protein